MSERRRYWWMWCVRGAALIAFGAGITYAAIPSPSGTISACYNAATGGLRVVDAEAGATCRVGEQMLAWSQAGVPGYQIVPNAQTISDTFSEFGSFSASCPAGKNVLGGGGKVTTPEGSFTSALDVNVQTFPASNGTGWSMYFEIRNPTAIVYVRTVYAICGIVGPPL